MTASHTVDNTECGYDSKMRYKPQINLLYMFTLGGEIGYPVYYKQYLGSTPDVSAFSDIGVNAIEEIASIRPLVEE